jgi:hypothetical protein
MNEAGSRDKNNDQGCKEMQELSFSCSTESKGSCSSHGELQWRAAPGGRSLAQQDRPAS